MRSVQQLTAGEIGELLQIRADFGFDAPFDPVGCMFNKALAGGALLDAGIYSVSLASMIAGSPVAVEAIADIGRTGVDEQSFCLFRYESGAISSLSASVRALVDIVAEIIDGEGKITVLRFLAAASAELHRCGKGETIQRNFPMPDEWGFKYEIQEVVDCLNEGKLESDVMPQDETLSIMQTTDAIRKKIGLVYDNDR